MPAPNRRTVFQIAIYLVLLLYLAGDLLVFQGPVSSWIQPWRAEVGEAAPGVVARVHHQPITESQLNHELQVYAFRRGLDLDQLSESRLGELRSVVLMRLIDDHLLRIKAQFNSSELPIDEARWKAEWDSWKARFSSELELQKHLADHGLSEEEMRYRLAARQQQEAWLDRWLSERVTVEDSEMRDFYDQHREEMKQPEKRRVRHLFAAALDHPNGQAEVLIDQWTQLLRQGKATWQEAARASEDLATAEKGGDLGWVAQERLPERFGTQVFQLPVKQPAKVVSELGVHWVEVMAIRPARDLAFDEVKDEIGRAVRLRKRQEMLRELRRTMREDAIRAGQVIIFEHGGISG